MSRNKCQDISNHCSSLLKKTFQIHYKDGYAAVVQIIEEFQKCHTDHPLGKFLGQCTDLKIKLDLCFRQEKAIKRKADFEQSKKLKERLQAYRKETADMQS